MKTSELFKQVEHLGYKIEECKDYIFILSKNKSEIVIPKNVVIDLKSGFESIHFTREISELVKEYARTPINERG